MQFKSICNITIDNPHADGRLTEWGFGRDWAAAEPKEGNRNYTPDIGGTYGWDYGGNAEYIKPLKAIAPTANGLRPPMASVDWVIDSGKWRETSTAGTFRARFYHFYDGRPDLYATGEHGVVESVGDYRPNLLFYIRRYPSGTADIDPPIFAIFFIGDGTSPYYGIILPALSLGGDYWTSLTGDVAAMLKYPMLIGRPRDLAANQWTVIDQFKGGGAPQAVADEGEDYTVQELQIEYTAGWMLAQMTKTGRTWAYSGTWRDALDREVEFALPTGPIGVVVVGHTAAFLVGQLSYPATVNVDAHEWVTVPPPLQQVVNYRAKHVEPAGTTVTVAEHPDSGVSVSKPRVTFTSTGNERSVFWNVQEYRWGVVGAASSAPVTSVGNVQLRVREATGSLNDKWRGGTCEVRVEAKQGQVLPTIHPNGKIELQVGLKKESVGACNATYDACMVGCAGDPVCEAACVAARDACIAATPPTFYRQFTGYIAPPEYEKQAPNQVSALIRGADGIDARLQHKNMVWTPSFEGWPCDTMFSYILNGAGIPNSLINIDADVSAAAMGDKYYLPVGEPYGNIALKFKESTGLIAALDTIVEARDLEWGVNQNGIYFLRPRTVHVADYSDWTLDDDTLVEDDVVYSLRGVQSMDDFANVIYVLVGSGYEASGTLLWDFASITDATAKNFIGDDWWKIHISRDANDAAELAARLWAERKVLSQMVYWTSRSYPQLMPGHYVKVQASNVGIPNNTIFRITRKTWRCGVAGADYSQDFEGVIVQEGT